MKKILTTVAILTSLIIPTAVVSAEDNIKVVLNGKELVFDVAPIIKDDRTFVPLRAIAEEIGAVVDWDDATKKITMQKDGIENILYLNNTTAYKNGEEITLDVAPFTMNDRTLVPVRYISESFGMNVNWDGATQTVIIENKDKTLDFIDGLLTKQGLEQDVRNTFEFEYLPCGIVVDNAQEYVKKYWNESEEIFAAYVEQGWWSLVSDTVMANMEKDGYDIANTAQEEVQKYGDELVAKNHLTAKEQYTGTFEKINDTTKCYVMQMKDLDTLGSSTYIGIVYVDGAGAFYFTLEKSFDGVYLICGVDNLCNHTNYARGCDNTKEAFVAAIRDVLTEDLKVLK